MTTLELLLRAVFSTLRGNGVHFVVLRNYEQLPFRIGNDLDLLVTEPQRARAEQIVVSVAAASGYQLHNRAEGPHIMLYLTHEETCEQIHIDLFTDCLWRGFTLLSAAEVCACRVHGPLFDIPHPAHEAVISFLKTVLYDGEVKERYRSDIIVRFGAHERLVMPVLARAFGRRRAKALVRDVSRGHWPGIADRVQALHLALMVRQFSGAPLRTAVSLWHNEIVRLCQRALQPVGISIALIGPDGSGKTAVARALKEQLDGTWRPTDVRYIHWKPPVLRPLSAEPGPPNMNPHGQRVRHPVLSLLFFLYHAAGFVAGGLRRIIPMKMHGKLVILDRYYYDFFVDQARFRMAVPSGVVRFAFHFVVKPDLVYYLDVAPEIAQSRKAEVPLEETARQREAFCALATRLPNAQVIDATRPVAAVAATIARHILGYMAVRVVQRKQNGLAAPGCKGQPGSMCHSVVAEPDGLRVAHVDAVP
jgi:thymidylate kinase